MALTKNKASELGKKSSRKGVPNKNTTEIREAFQLLVSSKIPQLSKWLDKVAEDNPEKALDIVVKFSDFVIPKLQRTEIKSEITIQDLMSLTSEQQTEHEYWNYKQNLKKHRNYDTEKNRITNIRRVRGFW